MGSILVIDMQYATADPAAETTPRSYSHPHRTCFQYEIPYNQEIPGEIHVFDSGQLEIYSLFDRI